MSVLQALQRLHLLNIYLLTNAAELGLKVVQALRGSMYVHMVWVHDHRVGSSGSGHGWGPPPANSLLVSQDSLPLALSLHLQPRGLSEIPMMLLWQIHL